MSRPSMIVLVRHAESQRNKAKKGSVYFADDEARKPVEGIPDHLISLTEEGARQAIQTGIVLRERFGKFSYAYHSGYARTEETLNKILDAWPKRERKSIRVRSNLFIRERDPGYTYDMTRAEVDKAFPWFEKHFNEFGGFFARPVGGESLAQVVERVYLFINMLFRDRVGQRVLVVTHGGTLRCIRFLLEHWDYEKALKWPEGQSPANCGITVYSFDQNSGNLVLQEYNTVVY